MATSPSHQLGEAIGDFFESAMIQYLHPIISKKGYYLDYKHPRAARNDKREVIGIDLKGNRHKLDIVIEKNGSEDHFGTPKAFIEMAWRRYVKHSKNKVQEISGAILPLVETHAKNMPFYAAVLAGEFTKNAREQLKSQGFYVLYFTYDEICAVFNSVGLSIHWEEDTSESDLQHLVEAYHSLDDTAKHALSQHFFRMYKPRLDDFASTLCESLDTAISEVIVIPLHGISQTVPSVSKAKEFIQNYDETSSVPIFKYEIIVRYNNGEEYTMKCSDKTKAIRFLNQYQ